MTPDPIRPTLFRSVFSVLLGLFTTAGLAIAIDALLRAVHILPPLGGPRISSGALALTAIYRGASAILGAYVTAVAAPHRPLTHALALGTVTFGLNILGTLTMWSVSPAWYSLSGVVMALPYAWVGGQLRLRQLTTAAAARSPTSAS